MENGTFNLYIYGHASNLGPKYKRALNKQVNKPHDPYTNNDNIVHTCNAKLPTKQQQRQQEQFCRFWNASVTASGTDTVCRPGEITLTPSRHGHCSTVHPSLHPDLKGPCKSPEESPSH